MSDLKSDAYGMVDAVSRIAEAIRRSRASCAADPGSDPTALAGHLADALRTVGGRLPESGAVHKFRWALGETPIPIEDPTGLKATAVLAQLLVECMLRGEGVDQTLADYADVAPGCRTKAEADARIALVVRERADRVRYATEAAHQARLGGRSIPPPTVVDALKNVVRAVRGKPAPAPVVEPATAPKRPIPGRPGEWAVGEDIDVPTVG